MRLALHWQILIAVILGILVGQWLSYVSTDAFAEYTAQAVANGSSSWVTWLDWGGYAADFKALCEYLGGLFKQALKMLIVPLVLTTIIVGIMGLASEQDFGRVGLRTIGLYLLSTSLAVGIGLVMVNTTQPGLIDGVPAGDILGFNTLDQSTVENKLAGNADMSFWGAIGGIFERMIPSNILQAGVEAQMLALIFFAALFGFFIGKLPAKHRQAQSDFWQGAADIMLKITDLIMRFAPIGVFALIVVAAAVSPDVMQMLLQLGKFSLVVLFALCLHMLGSMSLMLISIGRVNPIKHFGAMVKALLTAFSTASSSATLPVTMECVRDNAGVSKQTSGFVLPLGATINMDGTALYECIVVLFIAQAAGVDLSLAQQFLVVVLALATSIGVAGVPSASLVAITLILNYFGLPLEGLAAIWIFDRLLDMCRTTVNVWGDSCVAVIMARLEGEETKVALSEKSNQAG